MKKVLINYANKAYYSSQKLNCRSGLEIGQFSDVISYSPKDIDKEFFELNRHILKQKRGNGYWLWKPYFIKRTLDKLDWGDVLFYCDSGSYFIAPVTPLIEISLEAGQDIVVFELEHIEKYWTKRDAFVLMGSDSPRYSDTRQRLAGFSLWRKTNDVMDFVDEYLKYAQDERIITDMDNQCGYPNYEEFVDHRHDQSILSLLTKKHEIVAYRDPSQWGNAHKDLYTNSPYEQVIELTRTRSYPWTLRALERIRHLVRKTGGRLRQH